MKKQVFGTMLLALGALNSMLTLKAGIEPDWFNYLLLGSGLMVLSLGLMQRFRD